MKMFPHEKLIKITPHKWEEKIIGYYDSATKFSPAKPIITRTCKNCGKEGPTENIAYGIYLHSVFFGENEDSCPATSMNDALE